MAATDRRDLIATALILPMLVAGSAAILAARPIPPRPPLRRIARQPGAGACGIVLLILAAEAVIEAVSLLTFESSRGHPGSAWTLGGFASGSIGSQGMASGTTDGPGTRNRGRPRPPPPGALRAGR